jgi:hypothetical protein
MQTIKEQLKNLLSQEEYNFWIEPTLEIVDEYGKSTLVVKMEACQSIVAVMLKQHGVQMDAICKVWQNIVAVMLKRYGVECQVIFEVGQKEYQYPTKKPISVCNEAKREEVGQERKDNNKEVAENADSDVTITEQKRKEGLDALAEYLQAGIGLIGAYDSGATIAKGNGYEKAFTNDFETIKNLWFGKDERTNGQIIRRYYFKPKSANLICLDIDCKNGKDGLKEFWEFCQSKGKARTLLPKIFQDFPNNFPCWVATPSKGYHLYFRASDDFETKQTCLPNAPAVEIKYKSPLTAAGSYKDGNPYVLYGSLGKIPFLPKFIEAAISNMEKKKINEVGFLPQRQNKRIYKNKKNFGKPSWQQITDWVEKDYPSEISAGRNRRATYLSMCAKNYGYSRDETLSELINDSTVMYAKGNEMFSERDVYNIVKSIYKRN